MLTSDMVVQQLVTLDRAEEMGKIKLSSPKFRYFLRPILNRFLCTFFFSSRSTGMAHSKWLDCRFHRDAFGRGAGSAVAGPGADS